MQAYTVEAPYARSKRCVLVTPTEEDVDRLMQDVRVRDRDEWVGFTGCPMGLCLKHALAVSRALVFRREADGYPLCMIGAQPMEDGTGLLWFAGANEGYRELRDITALGAASLRFLHEEFAHLIALTDARNYEHHPWLIRLGFDFTGCVEAGPWSLPYWRVERHAHRSI
jgi:hypothetical protein